MTTKHPTHEYFPLFQLLQSQARKAGIPEWEGMDRDQLLEAIKALDYKNEEVT